MTTSNSPVIGITADFAEANTNAKREPTLFPAQLLREEPGTTQTRPLHLSAPLQPLGGGRAQAAEVGEVGREG